MAGEVPKAYVVKDQSVGIEENDRMVKRDIARHVETHKANYKWLKGGVEFIGRRKASLCLVQELTMDRCDSQESFW